MRNKVLLVFSALLLLVPFCFACLYALPFADDFCYGWTAAAHIPFTQKFLNQYLLWNGRYTTDVLVNIHPLITGKLWLYRLPLLTGILITPIALYLLFNRFIENKATAFVAALCTSVFYFNYMPDITAGQYWYIGIVNYHLPNILLLVQIAWLLHIMQQPIRAASFLISLLLLIAAIGCNEITAFLIPLFYFAALVYTLITKNGNEKILALHFVVALTASCFVILSPGNEGRGSLFAERHQLFHSLFYAAMQTARFAGKWSVQLPFLFLSLLLASQAKKVKGRIFDSINPWVMLGLAFFSVFTGAFFPYFATGILGQHRTINLIMPWFIILWMVFVISISRRYMLYHFLLRLVTERVKIYLLVASAIAILVTGNCFNILSDTVNGRFTAYQTAFIDRQAQAIQQPYNILPLKAVPNTFEITDTKADSSYWVDKCMRFYYTETKLEIK